VTPFAGTPAAGISAVEASMNVTQSLVAFVLAAGLLTITPGFDTALVLRTSTIEGSRKAAFAALGIGVGCMSWGAAVALGLGALLAASQLAYDILKWAGAAYLAWMGFQLIRRPRSDFSPGLSEASSVKGGNQLSWFWKGLIGNLLNPKVGVFYVSFLPQFVPVGVPVPGYTFMLAMIHVVLGAIWCMALILASQPLVWALRRPKMIKTLDRLTGCVFIGFGAKLALSSR
jgi:threonine/homoserine/homoserine lactone efflux protein